MAFNKVIIIGNITKDIELKQTPSGVSVASFTVAVNRKYKEKDGSTTTDFINCVAWRKTADFLAQYFKKGKAILVEGEIQTRSYSDNNGTKHYVTEVIANEVGFVGGKDDGNNDNYGRYVPDAYKPEATPNFEAVSEEDDFPF